MSSNNDPIGIEEFRARHSLPDTTEFALSPGGGRSYTVWVPQDTERPRGWAHEGDWTPGFRRLRPHGNYREGKAAYADFERVTPPTPEIIHASSTSDEDIATMLLAAADRMGPVRVVLPGGKTVVFTPAPATTEEPRYS